MLLQNHQLKEQLAKLQDGFIKLTGDDGGQEPRA
jgi:hypothetical protein